MFPSLNFTDSLLSFSRSAATRVTFFARRSIDLLISSPTTELTPCFANSAVAMPVPQPQSNTSIVSTWALFFHWDIIKATSCGNLPANCVRLSYTDA